jgi:peptide deformylase
MKLVCYPHPALRERNLDVEEIDEDLRRKVRAMFPIMYRHKGIGLAAPQVAWQVRLFIINLTGEPRDEQVFINPEIVHREGKEVAEEGCLSIPEVVGKIRRSTRIVLRAQNLEGEDIEIPAEDLLARAMQHEMDHLEGILILDRMSLAEKTFSRRKLKQLEMRYKEEAALS